MSEKKDIVLVEVRGGNWQALYVDGKLVFEDHEISSAKLLKLLDIDHRHIRCEYEHRTMPENFKDIKEAK